MVGPANNAFASAQVIPATGGSITGTSTGATKESGEPAHAGNAGGASVWYRWTAPRSGLLIVSTAGSSFTTLLAAYTGTAVNGLTRLASNTSPGASLIYFPVTSGTTYRMAVDGYGGASGAVRLAVTLA